MDNPLFEIYIPEAEENILILEDRVIGMEKDPENHEIINEAFRAIHSIKGGAGLAGFTKVKDFTHVVEDLFELLRSNQLDVNKTIISIILKSLDIIRGMIENIKGGADADEGLETEGVKGEIISILESSDAPKSENKQKKKEENSDKENFFFLDLKYYPEIFESGLDPMMFLSDLKAVGTLLYTSVMEQGFPPPEMYEPDKLYLSWKCFYKTDKNEKELNDIFCFVIDESEISIIQLNNFLSSPETLSRYTINGKTILDFLPDQIKKAEEPTEERRGEVGEEKENEETGEKKEIKYRRASDLSVSSYIRVPTEKLERIFNTVSELIISEAHLNLLTEQHEEEIPDEFVSLADTLKEITRVLQEQVTSLRMMSLNSTFDRFKRVVRDMALDLGKQVNLEIDGQDTELDKNMIEKLNDPLKHIIRNSIDHGLETEEERLSAGKPAEGRLNLSAYIEDGKVTIEIKDDGRGINREKILNKAVENGLVTNPELLNDSEILNLIFMPGLSTASEVTDLSGRGVGMDVVKNTIQDLNGSIDIHSIEGKGSTFKLHLPLTLAILDGMLVNIGPEKFVIPTLSILEIFRPQETDLKTISGRGEVVLFPDDYIPLLRIHKIFGIEEALLKPHEAELIVVNSMGVKAALLVDNVLEQFQVVLKSLQKNFQKIENISSATILGNGEVALILDIQNILQNFALGHNV